MRDSSQSPKGMTMSFHQITENMKQKDEETGKLKKFISELQDRNGYLEKIRLSYEQLQQVNVRLEQENAMLRQELGKRDKNTSSSPSPIGITTVQNNNYSPHKIVVPSPKSSGVAGGLGGGIQFTNSFSEYRPSPIR
jgi:cell shape-determining protein MreC